MSQEVQFTDGKRDPYTQMLIDAVPGKGVADSKADRTARDTTLANIAIKNGVSTDNEHF